MAVAADGPGALMKDRAAKLAAQRTTWMKAVAEESRGYVAEVARRKAGAAFMTAVAQGELFPPLKGAINAYATATHATAVALEGLNAEHVEKRVAPALASYDKFAYVVLWGSCTNAPVHPTQHLQCCPPPHPPTACGRCRCCLPTASARFRTRARRRRRATRRGCAT